MRNSSLGNLGITGDQSRIKCPRFFHQRRGRSQNVTATSTVPPSGVVKEGRILLSKAIEAGSLLTFQSNPARQLSK